MTKTKPDNKTNEKPIEHHDVSRLEKELKERESEDFRLNWHCVLPVTYVLYN